MAGSDRKFLKGAPGLADDAYILESIYEPAKHIVEGFDPKDVGMPSYKGILSERDVESLILYRKSLK